MLLVLLVGACSSSTAIEKPTSKPCPKSVPRDGSSCAAPGYDGPPVCSYGGNEHGQCTTEADCGSSTSGAVVWMVSAPDATCGQNTASCPSAFGMSANEPCSPWRAGPTSSMQSDCDYPEGVCSCVPCLGDVTQEGMGFWQCKKWSDFDSTCLNAKLGAPCNEPSGPVCFNGCHNCDGFSSVGTNATCQDGYWQQFVSGACSCEPQTCPASP